MNYHETGTIREEKITKDNEKTGLKCTITDKDGNVVAEYDYFTVIGFQGTGFDMAQCVGACTPSQIYMATVEALKKEGYIIFKPSQVYLDALQKDADRFNQDYGEVSPIDIAQIIVEDYYDF